MAAFGKKTPDRVGGGYDEGADEDAPAKADKPKPKLADEASLAAAEAVGEAIESKDSKALDRALRAHYTACRAKKE
jgi:hypothetical protein